MFMQVFPTFYYLFSSHCRALLSVYQTQYNLFRDYIAHTLTSVYFSLNNLSECKISSIGSGDPEHKLRILGKEFSGTLDLSTGIKENIMQRGVIS